MITLTEHQQQRMDKVCDAIEQRQREVTLVGPAGTGKTTILKELVRRYGAGRIALAAPTGRAVRQVSNATSLEGHTIHARLYGYPDEEYLDENGKVKLKWGSPRPPCSPGQLLVIDEASMVDDRIARHLRDMLPGGAQIVWVGDKEQLEPVEGTWGAPLDSPTAELTEVCRQAEDSEVLRIATAIRTRTPTSIPKDTRKVGQFRQWMLDGGVSLAWTHNVRRHINALAREGREPGVIVPGDRLVITRNTWDAGLLNGDLLEVTGAARFSKSSGKMSNVYLLDDGRAVYLGAFDSWKERKWMEGVVGRPVAPVDYGYCITVHKAQGSEWDEVVFCVDDVFINLRRRSPDQHRRLGYTAVTRARNRIRARRVRW